MKIIDVEDNDAKIVKRKKTQKIMAENYRKNHFFSKVSENFPDGKNTTDTPVFLFNKYQSIRSDNTFN